MADHVRYVVQFEHRAKPSEWLIWREPYHPDFMGKKTLEASMAVLERLQAVHSKTKPEGATGRYRIVKQSWTDQEAEVEEIVFEETV